jgi:hypothetical protein
MTGITYFEHMHYSAQSTDIIYWGRGNYNYVFINNRKLMLQYHIQFYLDNTALHLWIQNVAWTSYMYCNVMLKILNPLKVKTWGWYRSLTFIFHVYYWS